MANDNSELAAFVLRRGQIKGQLTRFQTFMEDPKSNVATQLRLRAEKIREAWSEFDAIQNNIEILDVSNEQVQYRSAFENLYYDLMSEVDDRLSKSNALAQNRQQIQGDQSEVTNSHNSPLIKLKPLEIPTFTGKFDDWVTFQDIFCALVHTNKSITDIQKFCYLRNALEGEASSLIKNLETSSSNYEIAWKIVTTRYNNTRMLIQTHTKRIFDLEPINKESGIKLKQLTDSLNAHIQALKALKHDPHNWGALLLHVIYTKLDTNSIRQWEAEVSKDELPSVQLMMGFLGKRSQMLESVENAKLLTFKQNEPNWSSNKIAKFGASRKGASSFLSTYKMKCYMCQQPHPIYKCTAFLALDIASRVSKVNELKMCSNCLKKTDHQVKQCPARKCVKCQKPHNLLLHHDKEPSSDEGSAQGNVSNDGLVVAHTADAGEIDNQVLLATAIIKVSSPAGNHIHGRALLDNGSQSNFITNNLVHKLGLKRHKVNIPICGISESKNNIRYKVTAVVQSLNSSYVTTIEFLVLSKITGSLPHTPTRTVSIPDNVNIADPLFNCPGNIDVLIGGDTYWDIMCDEKLKTKDGPYLQKTLLGWVVVGKTSTKLSTNKLSSCLLTTQNEYQALDNKIELFWKMEEISSKDNFTDEEKLCITHFNKNLAQNEDGRFVVKLPFKEDCHQLGNSYTSARQRFLSLEKRLIKNPELYMKYKMFMSEYENLNHMERINDTSSDKQVIDSAKCFYLPHSYVINDRSRTTKLRVVFDGSAKTSSGVSLNDTLMSGPKIQPDLLDIVVRFRTHKYAFSADITKMYRQVLVHEDHRDYQRVLWRSDPNDELKIYRLCTVTYGLAPAGFLAISCVNRIGDKTTNTKIKEIIKNDFCVDDCLTGADSLMEAIELRDELISIMRGGGFELSKWTTNHTDLFPNRNKDEMTTIPMDKESVKTLGLYWEPKSDYFTYVVQVPKVNNEVTKRHILAGLATLFDPLGLVGPIILVGKLLLQNVWREKIGWDSPVPPYIQLEWETYNNCLNELNSFSIPRWLGSDNGKHIEIHGFADASMKAYGACVYMRTSDKDGNIACQLVCAKSRIAPVKVISIPRLELCAALLLSRLIDVIIPAFRLNISRRYLWTDSTVTLAWIAAESSKWKTFVANRVSEIHTLTDRAEWGHVTSDDNPADVLSRGCTPSELKYNTQWWYGPSWLKIKTFKCSTSDGETLEHVNDVQSEERTAPIVVCTSQRDVSLDINKYSSLTKLIHVVSYLLRYKIMRYRNGIIPLVLSDR